MRQIAPPLPPFSPPSSMRPGSRSIYSRQSEPPAHRLYPNIREIFNQLIHFENSILVVRARRISCSRITSFGPFRPAAPDQNGTLFSDEISGLTIDLNAVDDVFLLGEGSSSPSIEILFKEDGFAVSIEPDKSAYSDFIMGHLIEKYASSRISPAVLRNAGAGAWLDEWQHVQSRGALHRDALNRFTASFEGRGFRFRASGETLSDFPDSEIHRITARDGRTHIFADNTVINQPNQNRTLHSNARN